MIRIVWIISSFLLLSQQLIAGPSGSQVIYGDVSIEANNQSTNINQLSDASWIDWEDFSIEQNQSVHFNFSSNQALSINRVVGQNTSEIMGQLTSNGQVYLINPNGVLFGEDSQVNVGGLFVSDHQLSDNSELSLSNNSEGVVFLGEVTSLNDLSVLASSIDNQGVLSADNLDFFVNQGALLQLDDSGLISILVPNNQENTSDNQFNNSGAIIANGQVYIGSEDKNQWLNQIDNTGLNVELSGEIEADSIDVIGDEIVFDDLDLNAQFIQIEADHKTIIQQSNLNTNDKGEVNIRAQEIQIIDQTNIDVGGGKLTVGGQFQGGNDESNNANFLHVGSSVEINADGLNNQDAGEVIIWSDDTTVFSGSISAQGGSQNGDGGFVEVSGKQVLVFRGDVNTSAQNGETGQLLLDPNVITIADGSGSPVDNVADGIISSGEYIGADITIYEEDLEALSAGTDINLQATHSIIINDLTDDALSLNQSGSVTFSVSNNFGEARFEMLDVNDSIDMTGSGDLNILLEGEVGYGTAGLQSATMIVGDVNMNGGNVYFQMQNEGSGTDADEMTMSVQNISNASDGTVSLIINNVEGFGAGAVQLDVGDVTVSGTASANDVLIQAINHDQSGSLYGSSTINLNGDISISGVGHTVDIETLEDNSIGGTINNYGDINSYGGDIVISAGSMELLDTDFYNYISALNDNSAGGDVDLSVFGANSINGNSTHSFYIETTNTHSLEWDEFTGLIGLTYQTTGNVDLGTDGAKNISNTELASIDAGTDFFYVQTSDDITTTNAVIATPLHLYADRDYDGSGTISLAGINTTDNNLTMQAADIDLTSGTIDAGTSDVWIGPSMASVDAYIASASVPAGQLDIEAGLWNAISTTGSISVVANTVIWDHNNLNGDVILDGSSGSGVEILGTNSFAGANTFELIGDTLIKSDIFMVDLGSNLIVNGALSLGETDADGLDSLTILAGTFDFSNTTSIDLLGDTGDVFGINQGSEAALNLPNILTSNDDPTLDVTSSHNLTMAGFSGGTLLVSIDDNNNSESTFTTTGTYVVDGLSVSGSLAVDDDTSFNGTWTNSDSVTMFNLDRIVFFNNSFISTGSMSLPVNSTFILGSSVTDFDFGSNTGSVIIGDIESNRPLNITSAGVVSAGIVDTASRALSVISDSDLAGDEAITFSSIRAGDLTLAGDFDWTFNPVISGDYTQTKGDISFTDVTISGFGIDLTSADSVSLSGTSNTLQARSGDIIVSDLVDDGSNAALNMDATQAITANSINTGSGNITLESDSDNSGGELASFNIASGGILTLTNDSILEGILNFDSITSTANITLDDATITLDSIDNSAWASTTLLGTTNSITTTTGALVFDNATGTVSDLTLISNTDLTLSNSDIGSANALLQAQTSIGVDGIAGADFTIQFDSNSDGAESFSSIGTNNVVDLNIIGTGSNDDVFLNGTWTLTGNLNTATVNEFNMLGDDFTANNIDFSGVTLLDFATGSDHTLSATGGDIVLADLNADRTIRLIASDTISLSGITTSDDYVKFTADDITGDGSVIDLGSAEIVFQTNAGETKLSVGDAGVDTFTIESNIWDNLLVGTITLDTIGAGDTITFLEDTLPANLSLDGSAGRITFDGVAQNFSGATINTDTDVLFLQDFTSDSLATFTGDVFIGLTNASAGDSINVSADFDLSSATSIDLLNDSGDNVNLIHTGTSDFNLPNITSSTDAPDLSIQSYSGITLSGFSGGDLDIQLDTDDTQISTLSTTGIYDMTELNLSGTSVNDLVNIDGTWAINGNVDSTNLDVISFLNDSFTANSIDFSGATTLDFTTGANFTLESTAGDIVLPDLISDRKFTVSSSNDLTIQSITTNNTDALLLSTDITGNGSAIDVGTGMLLLQANGASNSLSVGDLGVDVYTIESNIWDNISAGEIYIDASGVTDNITFLEDSAPADLRFDGQDGLLTFSGSGQLFSGANLTTDTDVLFLQNFNSDGLVDIDGAISIGQTNSTAGDRINITGSFILDDVSAISLLGDTGDLVEIDSIDTTDLYLANITSINGDPNLDVTSQVGINMNGFDAGNLTVELDTDNNSIDQFNAVGDYTTTDFILSANADNDSASIDGTWDISGEVNIGSLSNVYFNNDAFIANNGLTVDATSSITLGTDLNDFEFGTRSGQVSFGDLSGDRNLIISADGQVSFNQIALSSHRLNITSDDDLSGDESILANSIQAGDLNLSGDMTWDFDSVISGTYTQLSGDVEFVDANVSAGSMDMTLADSFEFLGSNNTLSILSDDLILNNINDNLSNANLTLNASGAITLNNVNVGSGDLTLNSNTDSLGNDMISVNASQGANLILNDNAQLNGILNFTSISNTATTTLNNAELTLNSLSQNTDNLMAFNGTQNTLNIINGELHLDSASVADDSELIINIGAGDHTISNINNENASITVDAVNASINQNLTLDGIIKNDAVSVSNINDLNINADMDAISVLLQTNNDLVMSGTAKISANSIEVDVARDATITGLIAYNDAQSAIKITTGRNIIDAGDSQYDITTMNAQSLLINATGTKEELEIIYLDTVIEEEVIAEIIEDIEEISAVVDEEIVVVQDESATSKPVKSNEASVGVLPSHRLEMVLPTCTGSDKDCEEQDAISVFLSALLIGGALPD